MASSDELHITVNGKGGHAGLPHLLKDPVVATAAMIMALQQIVSRNTYAFTPTVLSIGRVIADGATNVIPDAVQVKGTLRTMDEQWRQEAMRRIREVAGETVKAYGCTAEVDIRVGYPSVINDPEMAEAGREVVADWFGREALVEIPKRMTAEDFGFYSVKYPSLFFRWGVGRGTGDEVPLHNAGFVADEQGLVYATGMMVGMALRLLRVY